jgi:hypothetical protein
MNQVLQENPIHQVLQTHFLATLVRVRKCVWRTWCIGFSTIQLRIFVKGYNFFSRSWCTSRCIRNNLSQITWYLFPPPLRVKCRVLKIGKCIWLGCHVITSPKLQVDWTSVGVVYIWKSTQVSNNHVQEFGSMPLPNRALCSNVVTLVWLVVLVWNPITLSLSSRLGSSQVAEAWWYTRPSPSPWKACALWKETKVGQTPLGFPIMFVGNQGGFSCLVTSWQEPARVGAALQGNV